MEVFRVEDFEGAEWHGVLVGSACAPASERRLVIHLTRVAGGE